MFMFLHIIRVCTVEMSGVCIMLILCMCVCPCFVLFVSECCKRAYAHISGCVCVCTSVCVHVDM